VYEEFSCLIIKEDSVTSIFILGYIDSVIVSHLLRVFSYNILMQLKKTRIPHRLYIIKYELNIIGMVILHLNIKQVRQDGPT
jgi:hypothetical protein